MWSKTLRKFAKLPFEDKLFLCEATFLLACARVAILLFPFRWVAPFLGQARSESSTAIVADQLDAKAKRIGWAVSTVSHFTFWQSKCLAQAISAQIMLKRRHIPSTLYLGVAKDDDRKLIAHAWVRSGNAILTGASESGQYTVVSCFAGPS